MHCEIGGTQGPLGYVSALGATRLVHWLILVAPSCLRSHNARYIMLKSLIKAWQSREIVQVRTKYTDCIWAYQSILVNHLQSQSPLWCHQSHQTWEISCWWCQMWDTCPSPMAANQTKENVDSQYWINITVYIRKQCLTTDKFSATWILICGSTETNKTNANLIVEVMNRVINCYEKHYRLVWYGSYKCFISMNFKMACLIQTPLTLSLFYDIYT